MTRRRSIAALACAAVLAAGACASDPPHEYAGVVPDAPTRVDGVALPDLAAGGEPFALRAPEGDVLMVVFGFTNCPDVCPTTLHDVRVALRELDGDADRVNLAMVTVDPYHDLAVLPDYVHSFVPGGHALGTDDEELLAAVAEPFGVTYEIVIDEGRYQVGHTPDVFLVDDSGELVLAWPFGVLPSDIAADVRQVLG